MVTPPLQAPHATPVRKPIVLKKIVAHAVKVGLREGLWVGSRTGGWLCDHLALSPQIPSVHSPRRSPRVSSFSPALLRGVQDILELGGGVVSAHICGGCCLQYFESLPLDICMHC